MTFYYLSSLKIPTQAPKRSVFDLYLHYTAVFDNKLIRPLTNVIGISYIQMRYEFILHNSVNKHILKL